MTGKIGEGEGGSSFVFVSYYPILFLIGNKLTFSRLCMVCL